MSTFSKTLSVTALQPDGSGPITAYFNELPGLVVQGKSVDDVKPKLQSLLNFYIKRLQSISDFEIHSQSF